MGGCTNFRKFIIRPDTNALYWDIHSVTECYAKCQKTDECTGFFLHRGDRERGCQLYKKGCRQNDQYAIDDHQWEYYVMEDCSEGKVIFHV